MRNRLVLLLLAGAAAALAALAVQSLRSGVPADDPWLFPLLVVVPGLAAIALALSLRAPAATRANIAVLLVAVGSGFYIVEAVLGILPDPAAASPAPAAAADPNADRRTRFQVVLDLRAAGTPAYPSFGARGLRALNMRDGEGIAIDGQRIAPLAQLAGRTIVDCNESGQFSIFQTDERGFSNPPGLWNQAIDIAAVGDSFIQGSCVPPDQTLVAAIRERVPATLAAGIADAGPLVYLGIIKEYLATVKPRDVLWFHYEGNDLRNLAAEHRNAELRLYLEPRGSQRLLERQNEIERLVAHHVDQILADPPEDPPPAQPPSSFTTSVRQWSRLLRLRRSLALANVNERLLECCDLVAFQAALAEARRSVEAWGGRFHFVYLTAGGRYFHPLSALLDDDLRYRTRVLRIVRALDIPILDMHQTLRDAGQPTRFFFTERSHFSPQGYRLVGDAVLLYLEASTTPANAGR